MFLWYNIYIVNKFWYYVQVGKMVVEIGISMEEWRCYMYCVVLNKIKDIYILRHIIYDVDKNDSLNIIKEKYYADYNKTSTDEFHLCQTKTEVSDILSALKISH